MSTASILVARAARQREQWPKVTHIATVREAAVLAPVQRMRTRLPWLDHALGGGFVRGSAVMVHGEPGAGKSTLLAQAASSIRGSIYISSEEDLPGLAARCLRLGTRSDLGLLPEKDMDSAIEGAGRAPLVIFDSISEFRPNPLAAARLAVDHARLHNVCVVLVCHENKAGAHAGPRQLEHLIDTTIRLTRDPRAITTEKNRFGPANISLFLEMTEIGLRIAGK